MDIAKKTKCPLYILFIFYEKAYDKFDRNILRQLLAEAGCGQRFFNAPGESLKHTHNQTEDEI